MDKKYEIRNGYVVFKDSGNSLHRYIAKKEIWSKDRKKYPLEFHEYQVHHIDKNKRNNNPENLKVTTRLEHEKEHGIIRREQLQIIAMKVGVVGFFGILAVDWLAKRLEEEGIGKVLMFLGVFLLTIGLALWLSRGKEGKKYI